MADGSFSGFGPDLTDQGFARGRLPTRISPPPTKRQHTGAGDGRSVPNKSRVTALLARSTARLDESHRRHSDYSNSCKLSADFTMVPRREPERLTLSSSSTDRLNFQGQGRRANNTNSNNLRIACSNRQSKSGSLNKLACQICMRGAVVRYDPVIACPGCNKQYHDSCRKPALAEDVDPKHWRCFICLGGGSRRSSSFSIAAQPPSSVRSTPSTTPSLHVDFSTKFAMDCQNSAPSNSGEPILMSNQLHREHVFSLLRGPSAIPDGHDQNAAVVSELNSVAGKKPYDLLLENRSASPSMSSVKNFSRDIVSRSSSGQSRPDFSKYSGTSIRPDQPHAYTRTQDRTEILSTPAQRSSSPLRILSSIPQTGSPPAKDASRKASDSLSTGSVQIQTDTYLAILCSVCQRQRRLVKSGAVEAICHNCQGRSPFVNPRKLKIPETPEGTFVVRTKQCEDDLLQTSGSTPAVMHHSNRDNFLPWFESDVVNKIPKTTQRKVRASGHNETTLVPRRNSEHNGLLHFDYATTSKATNGLSKVHAPKMKQMDHPAVHIEPILMKPIADNAKPQVSLEQLSLAGRSKTDTNNTPPQSSLYGITHEVPDHISINSSSDKYNKDSFASELSPESIADTQLEHLQSYTDELTDSIVAKELSSDSREITISAAKRQLETRYTMRQLARIALVAANGARLTSSQIIMWISSTFSHLRIGEGRWEMNLRSALSAFDEFEGHRVPRSRGRGGTKVYDFSNANIRALYEREYSKFCRASNSLIVPPLAQPEKARPNTLASVLAQGSNVSRAREAVKSAPPSPLITIDQQRTLNLSASNMQLQLSKSKGMFPPDNTDKDTLFMPFERPKPRQLLRSLEFQPSCERKAPFLHTPQTTQPSIDTMTEAEKAQKIAEIKARPSRKKYFGSDHRLWHKRRYGLNNIHDERDGAWKLSLAINTTKSKQDHNMHVNDKDFRTLREVFDLPVNFIPMNDGQMELAFRDGTLVNGKLPRPRNVYRVGAMCGGRLTTRLF